MHSLLTRFCSACGWVLYFFSALTVASDFIEPCGELTLPMAIDAALQRNPILQSARFDIRAAEVRIAQAAMRPSPEINAAFENFGGNGAVRGTRALETTLSLSQVIELGGKRSQRIDAARAARSNTTLERDAKQLDILAEVTRRFIDVVALQQQLMLTRHVSALNQQLLTAITVRVAAARAPQAEQSRAEIALARARLEETRTAQILLSAQRRLAALWGSSEPRFSVANAELFNFPTVASFDELLAKLKATPDFLRFVSETRLRDAEWQLAQANAQSDITLGAGIRRFEASNDIGLVMNISMPLPSANRNQASLRAAQLRREQVQIDEQAAFITTQATLFDFYQNLQQARSETTALRTQLLPLAETALQQTRYGYERGRFSYVELASAQRELIDLQRAAIDAAATYHRVLAEIERLTNEPLAQTQDY